MSLKIWQLSSSAIKLVFSVKTAIDINQVEFSIQ